MYVRKESIRIYAAIAITTIIFLIVWITSLIERSSAVTDLVTQENSELSQDFKSEIVDINTLQASHIKQNNDGKVIGFNLPYKATYSFGIIKEQLESRGWTYVPSGNDISGSYYKNKGKYQWLFVNCVDVSTETCVVITVD